VYHREKKAIPSIAFIFIKELKELLGLF